MRRCIAVVAVAAALLLPSPVALAHHEQEHDQPSSECPDQSQNAGATPPDCGDDRDGDGVPSKKDNCPDAVNPGQEDTDGNGVGEACQDDDGDGHFNDTDNCPDAANPGQEDTDGNGVGDACGPLVAPVVQSEGECSAMFSGDIAHLDGTANCTFTLTNNVITIDGTASSEVKVTLWTMYGTLLGSCSSQAQDSSAVSSCSVDVTTDLPTGASVICRGWSPGIGTISCSSEDDG